MSLVGDAGSAANTEPNKGKAKTANVLNERIVA